MSGIQLFCFIIIAIVVTASSTLRPNHLDVEETRASTCVDRGTELINDDEPLLFLSTLDGTFIGVNHRNGKIVWQFKEEAAVKVPVDSQNALTPIFLPDPKDGSLYMLNSENHSDLKKLQFTIQQLVSSSPCRSADGVFYTGKKIDNWFMVDWRTGVKEELQNLDDSEKICPLLNRNSLFLGRTEYNLIIHDITRKERKWNVTFYDYAAKMMPPDKIKNYEHLYFSGSSTGKFAVLKNTDEGSFLWEAEFGSPIIGVYIRDGDGLVSVPFTTMDDSSMHLLTLEFNTRIQLFSTLYIGEHTHGLYALPAIATAGSTLLLLNGPSTGDTISIPVNRNEETTALLTTALLANRFIRCHVSILEQLLSGFLRTRGAFVCTNGYYKMPEYGIERLQIAGRSDAIIEMNRTNYRLNNTSFRKTLKTTGVQTEDELIDETQMKVDPYIFHHFINLSIEYILAPHNMELKIFMTTILTMMIFMFIYFRAQVREFKQSSSSGFSRNPTLGTVTAVAEELPDGSTRVGKILFNSNEILGKGCEGTFVFRGQFDNRQVAVKRLLPECFTVADREVCLLRESDQHPNVIRYFCMEQDKQFRYIALELCSATLQEYTEKEILNDLISPTEALAQATAGLEHLHSLSIVHRDLKPHNVLLSFPSTKEIKVRAMISDFGLCKKLQMGKASFSRKSGVTGTDGWIAPEIIHGRGRTTAAVDIFSLGCVFYYVLSKGKHPFGDSFNRQRNIMIGDYTLNEIKNDSYDLWSHLIQRMVTIDPLERPSISVIKNHPAFWNKDQILSFLQDVSDRIEKEEVNSKILIELETGNSFVLKGDWRDMIEQEIADDLRRYRSYRADSVRDLLRALRNKKHHYRELSDTVRQILGGIPDKFIQYWMDRFPKLVLHTWLAMQCVNREDVFKKYYSNLYTFPRIHDGVIPVWVQQPSPRWRFPNRSNQKLGGNRYSTEKGNSAFFSLYNGKSADYNWRQRPKIADDGNEYNNNINCLNDANIDDIRNETLSKPLNVINGAAADVSIIENRATVDELNDRVEVDNQENVEPILYDEFEVPYVRIDDALINSGESKCIQPTKHRHRVRHRHKRKQTDTCAANSENIQAPD